VNMPFVSQAQRRYMHAKEPELAEEYESKTPKGKKLPERVQKAPSPMDLAWAYLLKQVPPLPDWSGEDLAALRWIPQRRTSTYHQARPIIGEKLGQPLQFEYQMRQHGREALPGVFDPRIETVSGTWVSPADAMALANPDITSRYSEPHTLLGITESPQYWRANLLHGYPEGFQYGGYKPEQFVNIPLPNMFGERVRTPAQMQDFALDALQSHDAEGEQKADWFADLGMQPEIRATRWEAERGKPATIDELVERGLVGVLPPLPPTDVRRPPGF